jgi:cobalamin synthase
MQTNHRILRNYWAAPVIGILIGAVYLIAFSIGGQPLIGVVCLAVMIIFSAAVALAPGIAER